MSIKFTKMQGAGNDYVYIDCFQQKIEDPSGLAVRVSDRHFGIGSDGLILICPSDIADCKMVMFNADGSQSQMCGNGVRCVGRFAHDRGIAPNDTVTVETLAGIKILKMNINDGKVASVTVDMGEPELEPRKVPTLLPKTLGNPLTIDGTEYSVSCVSMGNPHALVFVEDVDAIEIEKLGPMFENNTVFPERVNTEFLQLVGENRLKMRVWERGSGETLACGTGACASMVGACLLGKCGRSAALELRGGTLEISWDEKTNHVFMTGPAEFVFDGEIEE